MRRLVTLLTLAVASSLFGVPAQAGDGTEPPGVVLRGNLGIYTTKPELRLRIELGTVNIDDPQGPEDRSFDVEVLRTDMRTPARPAWQPYLTDTTARLHDLAIGSGQILCARARQQSWGVTTGWSDLTCVVRARDDEDLRRRGKAVFVKDRRYADGRAMVMTARTRIVVPRVPRKALYGPLLTDRGILPNGSVCTKPDWHLAGRREPNIAFGVVNWALKVSLHRTVPAGKAVMRTPFGRSCPIGGFVVVPRWLPR